MSDPLSEFRDRLIMAVLAGLTLTRDEIGRIETDVRSDLGGDRFYLARHGEADRTATERYHRDQEIYRDWCAGERIDLLERRYNLSRKRLYAILKAQQAMVSRACLTARQEA